MLPTAASARHTECVCASSRLTDVSCVAVVCAQWAREKSQQGATFLLAPGPLHFINLSAGRGRLLDRRSFTQGEEASLCFFLLVTRNIQIQFSFAGLFIIFLIMRLKLSCRRRCSYRRLTIFAKDKHCVFYGKKTKNCWRLSTIRWKYLSGINSNWPKTNEGKNQSELCSERTDTWNCISLTPVKTTWLFEKIEFEFSLLQFFKFLSNETVPSTKLELVQKTK